MNLIRDDPLIPQVTSVTSPLFLSGWVVLETPPAAEEADFILPYNTLSYRSLQNRRPPRKSILGRKGNVLATITAVPGTAAAAAASDANAPPTVILSAVTVVAVAETLTHRLIGQ